MTTTVCITGDSILMEPLPEHYAGLAPLQNEIAAADVRINNLEMVLSDYDCCASSYCGGTWLTAPPAVLDDICRFGFNCFTFANNHTMDYGYGGLASTLAALRERKLPVSGAGMSLDEAAAPAMIDGPEGPVAVFSISSTCNDAARAGNAGHKIPARPGLNMLRHSETFLVNGAHMQALQEIAAATKINGRIDNSKRGGYTLAKPNVFSLGTADFALSEREGKTSAPHKADMERMRLVIEAAKAESKYVVVCFHSHEIKGASDDEPDEFIETFARCCIDWGASAVVGSGTHEIKAVELYRGKPIFYSIANFIFESERPAELPADYYEKYGVSPEKTATEAIAVRSANGTRGLNAERKNYRGLIPRLTFENGVLTELSILPTELGFDAQDKRTKGLPHAATPALAREIYHTLVSLSRPYGTAFRLDGNRITVVLPKEG